MFKSLMSRQSASRFLQMRSCSGQAPRSTWSFQAELPFLPVPNLEESCQLYLQTIRPLADDQQFENTKQLVNQFLTNEGPVLQQRLLKHAEEKNKQGESWLEKWWLDLAYLTFREPLPTNVNYVLIFDQLKPRDQILQAALIIRGAVEYYNLLRAEKIAPQMLRKTTPQCMQQYRYIYGVSRVAKPIKDILKPIVNSKHAAILCNGQIFSLQVLNEDNQPYSVAELQSQLTEIRNQARNGKPDNVAVITAIHRDESTRLRSLLEKNNAAQLETVDNALFSLSLDNDEPSSLNDLMAWLNGARDENTAPNRWFEKAIHFAVFKTGHAGLSGEHSPLDAPMVGAVADYIVASIEGNKFSQDQQSATPRFEKINWDLSVHLTQELNTAKKQAFNVLQNCDAQTFQYNGYGANWIKSVARASPDAYFQMGIQLAYYLLHKESSATYETGTARAFFHGRTDTVRTLSSDSKTWTHSMLDDSLSPEEKRAKLQKALDTHGQYMKRATEGKVIDRHFLGLRQVLQANESMPSIFTDPMWAQSIRYRISTSNMTGSGFIAGFGPTEPDGYGFCYGTRDNGFVSGVASFRSTPKTSTAQMIASLNLAFDKMRALYKEQSRL